MTMLEDLFEKTPNKKKIEIKKAPQLDPELKRSNTVRRQFLGFTEAVWEQQRENIVEIFARKKDIQYFREEKLYEQFMYELDLLLSIDVGRIHQETDKKGIQEMPILSHFVSWNYMFEKKDTYRACINREGSKMINLWKKYQNIENN